MEDEKDDDGAKAATGLVQICSAALSAGGSTPIERELARAVLGATEAAILGKRIAGPLEFGATADEFNLQMDAILNSTNASKGARMRSTRRVRLAQDLEAAGLVMLDRDVLARLFCFGLDLDTARARIEELEAEAATRELDVSGSADSADFEVARDTCCSDAALYGLGILDLRPGGVNHVPLSDFQLPAEAEQDPNVND